MQITAIRAQDHDLARGQTCCLHQCVIAVIIRQPIPDIAEHIFQHLAIVRQIDRSTIGVHKLHIMDIDRSAVFACLRQINGLLTDDTEAHVFQKRHPLRQHNRRTMMIKLQRNRIRPIGAIAIEVHEKRCLGTEASYALCVNQGFRCSEDFSIRLREACS